MFFLKENYMSEKKLRDFLIFLGEKAEEEILKQCIFMLPEKNRKMLEKISSFLYEVKIPAKFEFFPII